MQYLRKILFLFNSIERNQLVIIFIMILIMGFLDMLGVASLMPFMAVLTDPSIIDSNYFLNLLFNLSQNFGVENKQEFLFFLGLIVFFFLVFTLLFKALTTYLQIRFVMLMEYNIGKRLLEKYLDQPYTWFLNQNSAELGKNILSQARQVASNGIFPILNSISHFVVIIALISLLIFIDPKIAIIVGIILSTTYLVVYMTIRHLVKNIGKERLDMDQSRFKNINEAFGAIKQVKVSGLEKFYTKLFSEVSFKFSKHDISAQIYGQLPKFILEAISFGGMLLVILFLMKQDGDILTSLPTIALYAFAGYRLMPAFQKIYISFVQLRYIGPAVDQIYNDFSKLNSKNFEDYSDKINFRKQLFLKNISFRYPKSNINILENINLEIPHGKNIGFIGMTGSGKSTIIDIILALLEPCRGYLEIDGVKITNNNLKAWQSLIGYVPQQIYLTDESIASNIAFGVKIDQIDFERVKLVSKLADVHEFIDKELPQKYNTKVGEKGVRLSGGQLQRIGIARALYNDPKIIIFDEATSALDNKTEQNVMKSLKSLKKDEKISVILVTHRLNTVKDCDIIYFIDKGKIVDKGTYTLLAQNNQKFKNLVNLENK